MTPDLLLTGGDDHDLGALEAGLDLVLALEPGGHGGGLTVGEVGGDPGGMHDVVQVQLGHSGVQLEQQGQRLADTWGETSYQLGFASFIGQDCYPAVWEGR